MYKINRFFFIIIQFLLLIDNSRQSKFRQTKMAFKAIGNTIKIPMKKVGNTIKNTKSIHCLKQTFTSGITKRVEKQFSTRNNVASSSVKYLGKESIHNFKYKVLSGVSKASQLVRTESKKNAQMKSFEQIGGKELNSFLNMFSIQSMTALFVTGHLGYHQIPANTGSFYNSGQFGIDLPEYQKSPKEVTSERYILSLTNSDKPFGESKYTTSKIDLKRSENKNVVDDTSNNSNKENEKNIQLSDDKDYQKKNIIGYIKNSKKKCIEKLKEVRREYYLKNKEKIREVQREYRLENREKYNEQSREYQRKNKKNYQERNKKYYEIHKEKLIEQQKQYYQENKEKQNIYQRKYYKNNKEQVQERNREYYMKNKEKLLEQQREYYRKNKDYYLNYQDEYYKNNKEQVQARNRFYYRKNKEKIYELRQYKIRNKQEQIQEQSENRLKIEEKGIEHNKRDQWLQSIKNFSSLLGQKLNSSQFIKNRQKEQEQVQVP